MTTPLSAVHCHGIHTDSLGHYLSGLGLLTALAKEWPSIRGAWRDDHLVLVGKELSLNVVEAYLLTRWSRTPYERWWKAAQKQDTNAKSSAQILKERSRRSLAEVCLLDAHIIGASRNHFNPVFGKGGTLGRRDLAKLSYDAESLVKKDMARSEKWLDSSLTGDPSTDLPDLPGAGTWYVFANRTFNNGQGWYREGRISPWSILLAVEGALVLVGSANRRLGAQARPYAVFPFISEPGRPVSVGEIGASRGEFWAPLWERPATVSEVRELFQRGFAQVGTRAAKAPHEFALAVRSAGVDFGLAGFLRYEFRETTGGDKYYEAIPRQRISVPTERMASEEREGSDAHLILQLVESGWLNRLPYDPRDSKQKGKFTGLRGPVEAAIIDITESPEDPQRWQYLLQLLATTQSRIDRNRSWRERCTALPFLQTAWFQRAWPDIVPDEVRIAQSIASIGAGTNTPIILNIFGLNYEKSGRLTFPMARPQRAVWTSGDPVRILAEVLQRRLVDTNPTERVPLYAPLRCPAQLVHRFLSGLLDVEVIARWIPPLALIDWSHQHRHLSEPIDDDGSMDGNALVDAFFRPFFHCGPIRIEHQPLFPPDGKLRSALCSRLYSLLQSGNLRGAIHAASSAYHAAGRSVIKPCDDVILSLERLAAALLIPVTSNDISAGIRRWLYPAKTSRN